MKTLIKIFLLLQAVFLYAQDVKIIKILNDELKREIKNQFKDSNFNGDTITLIKEFSIGQNRILSVEIKKTNENGYSLERQEVPLDKIITIGKDINIILETEGKNVKTRTQRFYKNEEKQEFSNESDMFFTHLHFSNNEYVGDDLIKAFSKAGYKIRKDYWYD